MKKSILTLVVVALAVLTVFPVFAGEAAPVLLTSFGHNYLTFDMSGPMDTLRWRLYSLAISPQVFSNPREVRTQEYLSGHFG